jgi:hypothetical protein
VAGQSQPAYDPVTGNAAPGTAVMLTTTAPRFAAAIQCFSALELPRGSGRDLYLGGVDVPVNRSDIAARFFGEWLLMVDDDHVFTTDLVRRLIRHFADDRVDIVVPLVCRRDGQVPLIGFEGPKGGMLPAELTDQTGLMRVDFAATAVMLVRRRVFERVPGPNWFERNPALSHDLHFCRKARQAGCGIFCDLDTRVGHIQQFAIWPHRHTPDGKWGTPIVAPIYIGYGEDIRASIAQTYADTEPPQVTGLNTADARVVGY